MPYARNPLYILLALCLFAPVAGIAGGSGGVNAPEHLDKPYLILISIDGLGAGGRARTRTPAMDRLAASGVTAASMQPVWPSLTFPNHYSIATGLYPREHGLVGNNFPSEDRGDWYSLGNRAAVQDGKWYAGEPIWVSAEKAGMVAAAYFFVGTEAPIQGIRPTYSYLFNSQVPALTRVNQALEWLALPDEQRPHLVTLYFEYVDDASHKYGPAASETSVVVSRVDGYIRRLLNGIDALPFRDDVYVIIVSDHGQSAWLAPDEAYVLSEHVDIRDAGVVEGGNYVMLYYDRPDDEHIRSMVETINGTWEHGKAYVRGDTPEHWRIADDGRYADVLIQADDGHAVVTEEERKRWLSGGAHGWPPEAAGMGATFIASGPRLPEGRVLGEISVVDVYPLMLDILGLPLPAGYVVRESELNGILEDETEKTARN